VPDEFLALDRRLRMIARHVPQGYARAVSGAVPE
jgi:hypothetical protein